MNTLVPQTYDHSLDFETARDESNPRSLVNILPLAASNAIKAIPQRMFDLDVQQVRKKCVKEHQENLDLLRTAWWVEYNRAQKTTTPMVLSNIHNGICFSFYFKKYVLGNSFALTYVMTPPVDYQIQQHQLLDLALEQERRIMQMPFMKTIYNKAGDPIGEEIDTKLLQIQQKIAEVTKNRLMGMPVNRTMQVNQNINHNGSGGGSGGPKAFDQMDETELKAFIEQNNPTKESSKVVDDGGEVIDVKSKD